MYPHPTDCRLFIACHDGKLDIFECPPPNLFNPVFGNCDIPEAVDCGISCVDRPDGHFPHPHDCSLYLVCHSEAATIIKCPYPLLFDPVLLVCNYPDAVNCEIN